MIGNIPHKIAFSTFESSGENLTSLPDQWTKKYSSVPQYSGLKAISYVMK